MATTLVGLATRIAAKICAYTYAFMVNTNSDKINVSTCSLILVNVSDMEVVGG